MKATIFLTEEDVRSMVMDRWAPKENWRTGRKMRIETMNIYSSSGYVEFTDEDPSLMEEPEAVTQPPASAPRIETDFTDDIPF